MVASLSLRRNSVSFPHRSNGKYICIMDLYIKSVVSTKSSRCFTVFDFTRIRDELCTKWFSAHYRMLEIGFLQLTELWDIYIYPLLMHSCSLSDTIIFHAFFCLSELNPSRRTSHINWTVDRRSLCYAVVISERAHGTLKPFLRYCSRAVRFQARKILSCSTAHECTHQ